MSPPPSWAALAFALAVMDAGPGAVQQEPYSDWPALTGELLGQKPPDAVPLCPAVNSRHNETSPVVTPDGRHLFFLRVSGEVNDAFWVSADVIAAARER